jgi:hypothetical protein
VFHGYGLTEGHLAVTGHGDAVFVPDRQDGRTVQFLCQNLSSIDCGSSVREIMIVEASFLHGKTPG